MTLRGSAPAALAALSCGAWLAGALGCGSTGLPLGEAVVAQGQAGSAGPAVAGRLGTAVAGRPAALDAGRPDAAGMRDEDAGPGRDAGAGTACADGGTYEGSLMVTSAPDLLRARGCRRIHGDLLITSGAITDLSPLAQLESVSGTFQIGPLQPEQSALRLERLDGLERLREVGSLVLVGLDGLQDFAPLASLESAPGILITNMAGLISLKGLERARWSTISLQYLDALTRLDGLRVPEVAVAFQLASLPKLVSIAALEPLQSADYLRLVDLPSLINLDGLQALARAGGELTVRRCQTLGDLTGLGGLTTVSGTLEIADNAALVELRALADLESVGKLALHDNPRLPQCEAERLASRLNQPAPSPTNGPPGACAP
jgi:hypothetical protein